MEILRVVSVDRRLDKNQRQYVALRVTAQPHKIVFIGGVSTKVFIKSKTTTLIAYPISYLPSGEPEFGHDLEEGDKIAGMIITRRVLPYLIGSTNYDTASVVVAGDSTDSEGFEIEVEKTFKNNGYTLLTKKVLDIVDVHDKYLQVKTKIPEDCLAS